jgi:hypothetical protein
MPTVTTVNPLQLATLRTSAAALGVTAETAVLSGRPAHAIVEHAKEGAST